MRGFSGANQQCSGNLQPASASEGPPHSQIQLPAGGVMRWCLFTGKLRVHVGLCRYCLCSLGSPELPRQSYLHPPLCIDHDHLLFCWNMYSSRTKIESCEFSILNTCQGQYWNITGKGNSTDTKYLTEASLPWENHTSLNKKC